MSEDFSGLFGSETEVVTLAPGEALFEKGQPGRLMYVVKSGNLQNSRRQSCLRNRFGVFALRVMRVLTARLRAMNERAKVLT